MAFTFTDDNVKEIIESGKPVVIDFWATWCGPCMAMSPVVDSLAEEFDGKVVIGKYNTEDQTDFAIENRIMSIPTFLLYNKGQKVGRLSGSQTREALVEKINEML